MEPNSNIRSFPTQLIKRENGILLVRGNKELSVEGDGAYEASALILDTCSGEGIALGELLGLFKPDEREIAAELIEKLERNHFVSSNDQFQPSGDEETSTDVFFWNFKFDCEEYKKRLAEKIVVVGVNSINRQLCAALQATDYSDIELIDYDQLRNLRFFDNDGNLDRSFWPQELPQPVGDETRLEELDLKEISCVVASSDFGGSYQLKDWNKFCVDNELFFLPILLDRCIGKVGPFIIPGETACFECLFARENSNMRDRNIHRARDFEAAAGQSVVGFLPSMASILGDIAAVELTKFFGRSLPWSVGDLIEINLLEPEMKVRKMLKMPRCSVCSSMIGSPANSPLKHPFFPDDHEEYVE